MNWITRWKKIGIKVKHILKKQPRYEEQSDWKNCPQCKKITYLPDLITNSYICECSFHFDLPPILRLENLFDSTYETIEVPENINPDPLNFEVKDGARQGYKYIEKINKYRKITGQKTALMCATGNISNLRAVVVCFNPKFGAGRFGPAENEHFLKAANFAIQQKVDVWIVIYQSSGIDVHTGVIGLAGMTKSIVAMNEIKKNNIPTFCIAARATAGGTYASSFFMHDFIIVESKCVENLLFSGKRVTSNILKGTDQIPVDFGTASGIMKSGLADIVLESRKELKDTIIKLANIILKRLLQLHPKSVDLSLDRIKRLLKNLNNPEQKIENAIQVVGTNGKHSVCSTLREIFETANYSVNMNISPSLRRFNERYYLSGKYISDDQLHDLLIEVEKVNKNQNITFHEFICACFFLAASRNKSNVNILESGLFFRLDASNVLEKNIASVIMPIGLDHKDFLKKGTVDEIVYEKCSHLLNGSKIIVSEQKEDVLNIIKKNISKNSSLKFIFGEDYECTKISSGFIFKDKKGKINLPHPNLLGDFQISNVSTAIGTIRNLDQFKIKESHIREAITKIRSEGRLQFIKDGKLRKYVSNSNEIIIDGAHNLLAATATEKYLRNLNSGKKIIMLLGMMANKEHKEFIQIFKNRVHSIITLDIPNQVNFIDKEKLSKIARSCGVISKTENSIESALKNVSKQNNNAIIFCTGSLYFAGEILNLN